MSSLSKIIDRLTDRDSPRTEATIQADVRTLLLTAPFHLEESEVEEVVLESPVGDLRRIDVEIGTTVIEVKRDLRKGKVLDNAVEQLKGYVRAREAKLDCRYVGILTDGVDWRCYHLQEAELVEVSAYALCKDRGDLDDFLIWLEGVLATTRGIRPTPEEIQTRLGAGSSSYALDRASLVTLYGQHKDDPSVRMKRKLWARLLTTALGSQFEDSDDLFVEHTLLVNSAEILAHAVLGLQIETLPPASLLTGAKFTERGIYGVVEPDFFDWVIEILGGEAFIRTLARRLARFDWTEVEHDVLKVLYESIIGAETRKKLGEYYTPDWLAEKMVLETIEDPLSERVLDPACGSGTFLFHAVRRYLAAAEAESHEPGKALDGVSRHVLGMDLHPVAVTLARVTYVLALGRERLTHATRGEIQIPVYLGDSMQWQHKRLELWHGGHLVIQVDESVNLFSNELRFPDSLLDDSRKFDQLVEGMAQRAARRKPGSKVPSLQSLFDRFGVPEDAWETLHETFRTMCELHDEGRDHIWGYYVRNLARPVWLAQQDNRVDTLIGNPPWLAYRHMHKELQERFREMSESRGLWEGAKVATNQDLSGLFVARVIQLYLQPFGRFAFVMPNSVVDRAQFAGFRTGLYPDSREPVKISFDTPWDLRRIRPHFFPRGAAVVLGGRISEMPKVMPTKVETWSGRIQARSAGWDEVEDELTREAGRVKPIDEDIESPYRSRFRQGATVVPRVLFIVEKLPHGPLGMPAGKVEVRSLRSAYEKPPWKELESLQGVVESEFVRPLYLGANLLPYRTLPPARAVLPVDEKGLVAGSRQRLDRYSKLAAWWREAERLWLENRSSERLTLLEQLDYHGKLSAQFPVQRLRIVYAASGMHLCAAWIESHQAVVEHKLYWAAAESLAEARFLCAIMNAPSTTELARPLMSYAKDERDIDKNIWRLPIPRFDPEDNLHAEIAQLAATVEAKVQDLPIDETKNFISLRRRIRKFLAKDPTALEVEERVVELLGG